MALQTVNFGQYPVQKPAIANILSDFFKGYQMGQLPQQMAQEQKQKQLAAALQQLQLEHLPKQYELSDKQTALTNALKQKDLNSYDQKLDLDRKVKLATIEKLKRVATGGNNFSGELKNWVSAHPGATQQDIQQKSDELFDLYKKAKNSSIDRANKLTETQENRSQTNLGKLLSEADDISKGYKPGTGRTETFKSPEEKEEYLKNYQLKLQKERSDSITRNRAIYAGLVDNTFDRINTDKLVQYSGILGTVNKYLAKGQVLPKEDLKKYNEYKREIAKVKILGKQIRQFYGDSISPSNLEKIDSMTDPSNWAESPAAAKAQFEAFKDIVKQETGIYRKSLSSIEPFQEDSGKNKNAGKVYNLQTRQWEDE